MRSAVIWRVILFVAIAGCHSVTIRVHRGSSAAIERDDPFTPRADWAGRYISHPPTGLVDCLDLLRDTVGAKPCSESQFGRSFYQLLTEGERGEAVFKFWNSLETLNFTVKTDETGRLTQRVENGRYLVDVLTQPGPAVPGSFSQSLPSVVEVDDGRATTIAQPAHLRLRPLPRPEAIASFIHVSDGQIREPEAKLGGEAVSRRLDPLVQSFEHDYEQELYSGFVFSAIVDTINAEAERLHDLRETGNRDEAMPTAVIHTGDAVDAGLLSEFEDFRERSDALTIPWYQAVGNHDLLAFGNLQLTAEPTDRMKCEGDSWKGVPCTCTPISDLVREYNLRRPDNRGCERVDVPSKSFTLIPAVLDRVCVVHEVVADHFVMDPYDAEAYDERGKLRRDATPRNSVNAFVDAHCRGLECKADETEPELDKGEVLSNEWPGYATIPPLDDGGPCGEAIPASQKMATRSRMNGFDLLWFQSTSKGSTTNALELARAAPSADPNPFGFYCFEIQKAKDSAFKHKIWAFVLNTSTPRGAYGELKSSQAKWLDDRLAKTDPEDLVFVFAHHPLWGIFDAGERRVLLDTLGRHDNVVAYFAGHTHDSQLRVVHPPGKHRFWEVIGPSTLVFPQQARLVTVKIAGPVGWLDIYSFSPIGAGESAEHLERAMEGAERDTCHQNPWMCDEGRPRPPAREVTFPRLYFRLPGRRIGGTLTAAGDPGLPPTSCTDGSNRPTWIPEADWTATTQPPP